MSEPMFDKIHVEDCHSVRRQTQGDVYTLHGLGYCTDLRTQVAREVEAARLDGKVQGIKEQIESHAPVCKLDREAAREEGRREILSMSASEAHDKAIEAAREDGIASVTSIRCVPKHHKVPIGNRNEISGGECGACEYERGLMAQHAEHEGGCAVCKAHIDAARE